MQHCEGRLSNSTFVAIFLLVVIFQGASSVPAYADSSFPTPVDRALEEAEAHADLKVSYTMSFRWFEGDIVSARFDAESRRWTPVKGNPDRLERRARKKFRTYQRVESKPGGLIYADYRPHLSDLALISETAERLVYQFISPQTPKSVVQAQDRVKTELVVDRHEGHLTRYAIQSLKPFKPNAVSKLDEFVFEQTFSRISPDFPPVMTHVYWRARGKRLLSTVDEEYEIIFSDFEIVP